MSGKYTNEIIDACKNGMTNEEMKYLFNDLDKGANTLRGKIVLRLFYRGVGKAKRKIKEQKMANQITQQQIQQPQMVNQTPQMDIPQMQKTLGTYKQ